MLILIFEGCWPHLSWRSSWRRESRRVEVMEGLGIVGALPNTFELFLCFHFAEKKKKTLNFPALFNMIFCNNELPIWFWVIWVSLVILLHGDWNVNETFFPLAMLEIPSLAMPLMKFQWKLKLRLSCFWDCNCFPYLSSTTSSAWGVFWLVDCVDNWLWVIFLKRRWSIMYCVRHA